MKTMLFKAIAACDEASFTNGFILPKNIFKNGYVMFMYNGGYMEIEDQEIEINGAHANIKCTEKTGAGFPPHELNFTQTIKLIRHLREEDISK